MATELPLDTEKALDAIAKGWTRKPTVAHPACLCGGRAEFCSVSYVERDGSVLVLQSPWPKTVRCPVH